MLVFSGFNQRAVIAFVRTLHECQVDYAIIAVSEDDPILLTEYAHKVLAVRRSRPLMLDDLLQSIQFVQSQIEAEEYIIAPVTEALNRFLLEHRAIFEQNRCQIPLVSQELYEKISDKLSFGELCRQYDIRVPEEVDLTGQLELPIVAKPKKYFSSEDGRILAPIIIQDASELDAFVRNYHPDDFFYQTYVGGRCIYLLYYFHSSGEVFRFSQENLVQQPGGKSMLAAVPADYHHSQESDKYVKLFEELGFRGFVMVEVKLHNGIPYMIEANPRFWGPSQLFVDAGVNFFQAFLHDTGLLESLHIAREIDTSVKYFWFGGLVKHLAQGSGQVVFHHYDQDALYRDFWDLLTHDIYLRQDTNAIFEKELYHIKGARNP